MKEEQEDRDKKMEKVFAESMQRIAEVNKAIMELVCFTWIQFYFYDK